MNDLFHRFAHRVSELAGSPWAFSLALLITAVWAVGGFVNGFSDSWQLIINTLTTILTFLIVFLIQNTQNRDAKALHLKLDELLRVNKPARDSFVDLEDFPDEELNRFEKEFQHMHEVAERARSVAARRRARKS